MSSGIIVTDYNRPGDPCRQVLLSQLVQDAKCRGLWILIGIMFVYVSRRDRVEFYCVLRHHATHSESVHTYETIIFDTTHTYSSEFQHMTLQDDLP